MLVTDGVVEMGEEPDAAFGLERLSQMVGGIAERPLPDIVEAINAEVRRHGKVQDERTVLLIRMATRNDAADQESMPDRRPNDGNDPPEALEARWRKLLDELTAELAGDP